MDSLQAFELDAALAYRYDALEYEDGQDKLNFIMNGLRGIMISMGAKKVKLEKFYKKLGKTTEQDAQEQVDKLLGNTPVERGDAGVR